MFEAFANWGLPIPSSIQKRIFKFLLKRTLGRFLSKEIDLEQLEVQLGAGFVQLNDLEINVEVSLDRRKKVRD